jgi:signal transduction histidine kinase
MAEKIPTIAERCERQVDRLTRLVEELLDVTKIGTGKLQMNPEPFDLSDLVREVCSRFTLDLSQAGCDLELSAGDSVSGRWDRFRLDQVLSNLITNAIKYAPGNPIEISVKRAKANVVLSVRDHGVGIAPENQGRIFAQFERAVERGPEGLGLGLYIAKKIVEAHRGSIAVDSERGKGAQFTVTLPVQGLISSDSASKGSAERLPASVAKSP